nr:hypothetical protein [Kibdelosporangium sp. MJ126-NF4]CEL19678.1 hypothetical protein [Kibdelosporangium sp. MJ126-NF4]CTQ94522.1 hypothetical protein [Kibdelosporangium sp. MJ126-NF4]
MTFTEKTARELYRERARLVAFLAALYPAVRSSNDPHDDRTVVYIQTPTGQLSWHIDPADVALLAHAPAVPGDDPRARWDGHTTDQKHIRLATLTQLHLAVGLADPVDGGES